MKKKPYIIFGIVVAALAYLILPFADMIIYKGTTYADGLKSIVNCIWAIGIGASMSFSLWRGDKNKGKQQ